MNREVVTIKLSTFAEGIISSDAITLTNKIMSVINANSEIESVKDYIKIFTQCASLSNYVINVKNDGESWAVDAIEKILEQNNA